MKIDLMQFASFSAKSKRKKVSIVGFESNTLSFKGTNKIIGTILDAPESVSPYFNGTEYFAQNVEVSRKKDGVLVFHIGLECSNSYTRNRSDSLDFDSLVVDSVVDDSLVVDFDSLVVDSVDFDSIVVDSLVFDSLVVDSVVDYSLSDAYAEPMDIDSSYENGKSIN